MAVIESMELAATAAGAARQEQSLSRAAVALLKGIVSRGRDEQVWQDILSSQTGLKDYFSRIGLILIVDELDEFAYLRQDERSGLPRIVSRYPLSFALSMLLVQLRKALGEYDRSQSGSRLVLGLDDIVRRMEPFLPAATNEMKFRQSIEHLVNSALSMGFLQKIKGKDTDYEVRPMIRSFVDAQWLDRFDQKLTEYVEYGEKRHAGETIEPDGKEAVMDELIRDDR